MAAAKTPKTPEQTDLKTYEVISPLNHDGTPYAIGDTVDLADAQAAPLLGHTVREPVSEQADQTDEQRA